MSDKRRIFHEELGGDSVVLSPEESHHISKVLRLKPGDAVEVFDGKGGSRPARVGEGQKRQVEIVFAGAQVLQKAPVPGITLAVPPPKGQRMDTLVQMAQEIGIDELIPIVTDNSVQQEFSGNRYARWRRVAISAAKQSGTNFLLKIRQALDFDELLKDITRWDLCLLCHTGADCQGLREFLSKRARPRNALLAVGPEGGFSGREVKAARDAGCDALRLPAATLRVETAAVFALSAVCCQFDREIHVL